MRNVFLLAVLSAGCLADVGDEVMVDDELEELDDDTSSRVALNGLTLNRTQLLSVAQGSLASAGTRVPTLFASADGREQFTYLVSCSLAAGTSVTIAANGTTYVYSGTMNLAKEWKNLALPTTKYKLVSACMLARTNYFATSVPISMRGTKVAHKTIEETTFTVLEGAFWGDVFTTGAKIRACASPLKLSGSTISTLPQRECAVSLDGVTTKCGFSYAGNCSSICTSDPKLGFKNCEGSADTIAVFLQKP